MREPPSSRVPTRRAPGALITTRGFLDAQMHSIMWTQLYTTRTPASSEAGASRCR